MTPWVDWLTVASFDSPLRLLRSSQGAKRYSAQTSYGVRVLIADDVEVIRSVIRDLLAREPTIEVCGEAANFSQTFDLATSLKPDVILLDLHMPDGERPKSDFANLQLLSTQSRILAMSLWHEDEETQIIARGYGAVELLDKGKLFNELIPAIQRVSRE